MTKDFISQGRLDLDLPLIRSIIASNENQIRSGVELIRKSGKKKVGVLGFSFKAGTDDLRESPIVELIETLIGKGYSIKVYDKNVSLANLMGANKEFIERQIPHIAKLMCKTIEEVVEDSEIVILGNKDEDFKDVVETCSDETIIIDLCRLYEDIGPLPSNYEGICW